MCPDPKGRAERAWAWCWTHDRRETFDGTPYRVCLECGHVYLSKRELRREYRNRWFEFMTVEWGQIRDSGLRRELIYEMRAPLGSTSRADLLWDWVRVQFRRADRVTFCPLCMHDF